MKKRKSINDKLVMKNSESSNTPIRKKVGLRNVVITFISLLLVFGIGVSVYVYRLLDQSAYIDVPITDDYSIPSGLLDNESDPNEVSSSDVSDTVSVSSGSTSYASVPYKPQKWGDGRVGVYYDSRFPIKKVAQKQSYVENYLIFGIDALTVNDKKSRTDSIIIVSIDSKNNSIKLTSIMRDTQVDIDGRSLPNKINAAYVFGGIGLMINTINRTFDLDIQKFAMVDMLSSEGVIDGVGGVYIDVTAAEVKYINGSVDSANYRFKDFSAPSPLLKGAGRILLNGRQAVGYGRIRYIGTDTARTQRQRNILTQLIVQFKASPLSSKLNVFDKIAQSFESNIKKNEMVFLAFDSLAGMKNIQQYRIPQDGMYKTNLTNYMMKVDFARQIPALHAFIWGDGEKPLTSLPDENPEPTATTVPTTTQAPTSVPTLTVAPTATTTPIATPAPTVTAALTPDLTLTATP